VLLVPYTRRRRAEQLFAAAGVEATWSGAPSAEAIRAGDQERLLHDPMLTEPAADEDLALARLLLERVGPDVIAAALIRQHRARLPAPEDLFDPGEPRGGGRSDREPRGRGERTYDPQDRPPRERGPRREEGSGMDAVWFRMTVGRAANADPKWLIPLICRRGHVTKKDIGAIRIFDRETKFEISREAVDHFSAAVAAATKEAIRIEPAAAPGPKTNLERDARPPQNGKQRKVKRN